MKYLAFAPNNIYVFIYFFYHFESLFRLLDIDSPWELLFWKETLSANRVQQQWNMFTYKNVLNSLL